MRTRYNFSLRPQSTWARIALVLILNCQLNGQADQQQYPQQQQQEVHQTNPEQQTSTNQLAATSKTSQQIPLIQKCSRQSVILARQMLIHELELTTSYNPIWFNDFDRDEMIEEQKQSLSNIVMSGAGTTLLNSDGQPLMEIEASYFRPLGANSHYRQSTANVTSRQMAAVPNQTTQPISIKLIRRHSDRCYLHNEKAQYTYVIGISVGPFEHNLDVVYNLPKELRLSQPLDWRYAQISLLVPRMVYEITLKQPADYKLNSIGGCPLEVSDVTFISSSANKSQFSILTSGLANNNQTAKQIDRLFDDYTRPAVSNRLRQVLKFYLNTKTIPLKVQ